MNRVTTLLAMMAMLPGLLGGPVVCFSDDGIAIELGAAGSCMPGGGDGCATDDGRDDTSLSLSDAGCGPCVDAEISADTAPVGAMRCLLAAAARACAAAQVDDAALANIRIKAPVAPTCPIAARAPAYPILLI